MTKERPDAEIEQLGLRHPIVNALTVNQPNETLVFELAFAIDDPAGLDAVLLANALIEYGRAVPESQRRQVAAELRKLAADLAKLPKVPT